ncbi:DNA-processing protein DprA [Lachnospiraceae bacterium ZAX-1]
MKYQYWFANIENISNRRKNKMIALGANPMELYNMPEASIKKLAFLNKAIAGDEAEKIWNSKKTWHLEKEYEQLQKDKIKMTTIGQPDYPSRLKDIYNPPYCLYVRGTLPNPEKKAVAIVGARMCSEYGRAMAETLARTLGKGGVEVISGMALGIDGAAHLGAIDAGGSTYAVFGCGVSVCYPPRNWELYEKIPQNGAIISEFPIKAPPIAHQFPMRNRLISGLADVTVVIEAKEKSGSLITADFALDQGKDIYAVPGRISDALSQGTNRLIRQGAGILLSAEDFLEELQIFSKKGTINEKIIKLPIEKFEKLVYSCLDLSPRNVDWLIEQTALSFTQLVKALSGLQSLGYITEVYKNYYIRTHETYRKIK